MLTSFKTGPQFSKKDLRDLIESDLKKDLHMHTCYSDGALTPRQLIDMRAAEGYELLAITDHDGIEGSYIGAPYAESKGIHFVYGIEFDSEDSIGKDLHMLGYGLDPENRALQEALTFILKQRAARNERFRKALSERGYDVTPDEIFAINQGRFVGKPTFALALKHKGKVESQQDAFNTIFQEPEIKSIKKTTLPTKRVIDLIHTEGGLAVLAHPLEQRHRDETFAEFEPRMYAILDKMTRYGIDGLECYHPSADSVQQEMLAQYAREHGLMITRGSDFHSEETRRDFKRYHRP